MKYQHPLLKGKSSHTFDTDIHVSLLLNSIILICAAIAQIQIHSLNFLELYIVPLFGFGSVSAHLKTRPSTLALRVFVE